MAKLEIDLAPDEQAQLERQAEQAGLPITDWARQTLLGQPEPAAFITNDGEVFLIPDMPEERGLAAYGASETAFSRLWDTPEEDVAWNDIK